MFLVLPKIDPVDRLLAIVKVLCSYTNIMPSTIHQLSDSLHAREFVNFVWKETSHLTADNVFDLHLYSMKLLVSVGVSLVSLSEQV